MQRFLAIAAIALAACSEEQAAEAPPAPPAASAVSAFTDAAMRSVYTSLGEGDCRLVSQDEETGGTVQRCPGVAGYALEVSDFDARMSVTVVAPGGAKHPLQYTSVITHGFSALGPRAEWRVSGTTGRPQALIVRVNASEDPAYPERTTSYLAVARVAPRGSCVVERIDPVSGANVLARQAADRAAGRRCLEQVPS